MNTDLAGRLRQLADHIDQHDLPAAFLHVGRLGVDVVTDSPRAANLWADSLGSRTERHASAGGPMGPHILHSAAGRLDGEWLTISCYDRAEALTLRDCGCNWRNLCDRCADLSTPDEVAQLRAVGA